MTLTLDPNYGWSSPGEKKPSYKEYKIKVAGVLTEGDWQTGYGIYMPITEVQKLLKEKEKAENQKPQPGREKKEAGYNKVDVKVNDMKNVQEVQKQIKEMGYEAYSLNDELESMKKTSCSNPSCTRRYRCSITPSSSYRYYKYHGNEHI